MRCSLLLRSPCTAARFWCSRCGRACPCLPRSSRRGSRSAEAYPAYGAVLVAVTTVLGLVGDHNRQLPPTRRIAQPEANRRASREACIIPFLLKGLWRDPSRSLFPFLTVVAGVTLDGAPPDRSRRIRIGPELVVGPFQDPDTSR